MEKFILAGIVFLILWEYQRRINKLEASILSIEIRLREKVDKPTELEKLMNDQKRGRKLTKEELDKIMTPEEKESRKKLYGSEYPIDRD